MTITAPSRGLSIRAFAACAAICASALAACSAPANGANGTGNGSSSGGSGNPSTNVTSDPAYVACHESYLQVGGCSSSASDAYCPKYAYAGQVTGCTDAIVGVYNCIMHQTTDCHNACTWDGVMGCVEQYCSARASDPQCACFASRGQQLECFSPPGVDGGLAAPPGGPSGSSGGGGPAPQPDAGGSSGSSTSSSSGSGGPSGPPPGPPGH